MITLILLTLPQRKAITLAPPTLSQRPHATKVETINCSISDIPVKWQWWEVRAEFLPRIKTIELKLSSIGYSLNDGANYAIITSLCADIERTIQSCPHKESRDILAHEMLNAIMPLPSFLKRYGVNERTMRVYNDCWTRFEAVKRAYRDMGHDMRHAEWVYKHIRRAA